MKAKCSVTFEFDVRSPETWRGEVEGTAASTICRRAVERANEELKPRNWSSMVCVILEREGVKQEEEDQTDAT